MLSECGGYFGQFVKADRRLWMSPEHQYLRAVGIWGAKLLRAVFILVNEAEPGHLLTHWYVIVPFCYQHTTWLNWLWCNAPRQHLTMVAEFGAARSHFLWAAQKWPSCLRVGKCGDHKWQVCLRIRKCTLTNFIDLQNRAARCEDIGIHNFLKEILTGFFTETFKCLRRYHGNF